MYNIPTTRREAIRAARTSFRGPTRREKVRANGTGKRTGWDGMPGGRGDNEVGFPPEEEEQRRGEGGAAGGREGDNEGNHCTIGIAGIESNRIVPLGVGLCVYLLPGTMRDANPPWRKRELLL